MRTSSKAIALSAPLAALLSLTTVRASAFEPSYQTLATNRTVSAKVALLTATVDIPAGGARLFIASDGSCVPATAKVAAGVYVEIDNDGVHRTSDAIIDWTGSDNPNQHAFNVIGAPWVSAGRHSVVLYAEAYSGAFVVGSDTNMSVMLPRAKVFEEHALLGADTGAYDFSTSTYQLETPLPPGHPTYVGRDIPHQPIPGVSYSGAFDPKDPWVVMASGNAFHSGSGALGKYDYGDAMWGLFVNGQPCGNRSSTWSVNDLWFHSELRAPISSHGFFENVPCRGNATAGERVPRTVSFDASEFPWTQKQGGEDPVRHAVGSGTRLIVLTGGMKVRGSAWRSQDINNTIDYVLVGGSDHATNKAVPALGSSVEIARAKISIPPGHSGVVFFSAKTRNLGVDKTESGGDFRMWIDIEDCIRPNLCAPHHGKSSVAIQQVRNHDSQRTMTASYLAAGANKLQPGYEYIVKVMGRVDGSLKHGAMTLDVPLVYFDDEGPAASRPPPAGQCAPQPMLGHAACCAAGEELAFTAVGPRCRRSGVLFCPNGFNTNLNPPRAQGNNAMCYWTGG
jgi:hypothetical protein